MYSHILVVKLIISQLYVAVFYIKHCSLAAHIGLLNTHQSRLSRANALFMLARFLSFFGQLEIKLIRK